MYNLIKLQKHDAFYQSREGGKCSIKCFNADLQCHTKKAVCKDICKDKTGMVFDPPPPPRLWGS